MNLHHIGGPVEIGKFQDGYTDLYVAHNGISILLKVPSDLSGISCAQQADSAEYVGTVVCSLVQKALSEWVTAKLGKLDS